MAVLVIPSIFINSAFRLHSATQRWGARWWLEAFPDLNGQTCSMKSCGAELALVLWVPFMVERYAGDLARAPLFYCKLPVVALTGWPMASPETRSSTLRFCCRPAELSLEATGRLLPKPLDETELVDTPSCTR